MRNILHRGQENAAFNSRLQNFHKVNETLAEKKAPLIARIKFKIVDDEPCDTFVDMSGWNKGIVIINGFNIGRYWKVGPQRTLYLPAPLLRTGENTVQCNFLDFYCGTWLDLTLVFE